MKYSLTSNRLSHPELKPLLQELVRVLAQLDTRFYVIGATARDMILEMHQESAKRLTYDLDIAISIENWELFNRIQEALINTGHFKLHSKQLQRYIFNDLYEVDLVPFGVISNQKDKLFWPPDESFAMTVLGFQEVYEKSETVVIDDELSIQIASLTGIFILKLFAWKDRHKTTTKDAEDIGFILQNYLSIHMERAVTQYYDSIFTDDYSLIRGSGSMLGLDMCEILPCESVARQNCIDLIEKQLEKREVSELLNQIIETNRYIPFDDAFVSFTRMLMELKRTE